MSMPINLSQVKIPFNYVHPIWTKSNDEQERELNNFKLIQDLLLPDGLKTPEILSDYYRKETMGWGVMYPFNKPENIFQYQINHFLMWCLIAANKETYKPTEVYSPEGKRLTWGWGEAPTTEEEEAFLQYYPSHMCWACQYGKSQNLCGIDKCLYCPIWGEAIEKAQKKCGLSDDSALGLCEDSEWWNWNEENSDLSAYSCWSTTDCNLYINALKVAYLPWTKR